MFFPKYFTKQDISYSVICHDIQEELSDKQTPIRRSKLFPNELVTTPNERVKTLFDLLQVATQRFPKHNCLGERKVLETFNEEKVENVKGEIKKKNWIRVRKGPYEWKTFSEVSSLSKCYGRALYTLIGSNDKSMQRKVALFAETSSDWTMIAHGAWSQNLTIVTALPNLKGESLSHSLGETECPVVFTNGHLLKVLVEIIEDCPTIRTVIFSGDKDATSKRQLEENGCRVMTLEDLFQIGKESSGDCRPPSSKDIAAIMYTSGTTGLPKGVTISHGNIIATIGGVAKICEANHVGLSPNDSYLAYLPSSHILELAIETCFLFYGVQMGFGSARTLTPSGMKNSPTDLKALQPTIFAGVPKVYENIRKKTLEQIQKQNWIFQKIFWAFYHLKEMSLRVNESTPILDYFIFRIFRENLGGKVRIAVSAGAPLSEETHWFIRTVFVWPVVQIYGLTETCGAGAFLPLEHTSTGRVGAPLPSVELKLKDIPDMNYFSDHSPPQGEVWIRGPSVASGYFNNEEKTKESFKEGGWFATGDIGQWESDETLSIIDRISNLVKLPNGEFISLDKMESKYSECPSVDQIAIYADSNKPFAVAIVVPKEEEFKDDKEGRKQMLKDLEKQAKESGMESGEIVKGVIISSNKWTEENQKISGAGKLKRKAIVGDFKDELEKLFAQSSE